MNEAIGAKKILITEFTISEQNNLFKKTSKEKMNSIDDKNVPVGGSIVPDGGWGWMIVLASFMIHFVMDG